MAYLKAERRELRGWELVRRNLERGQIERAAKEWRIRFFLNLHRALLEKKRGALSPTNSAPRINHDSLNSGEV